MKTNISCFALTCILFAISYAMLSYSTEIHAYRFEEPESPKFGGLSQTQASRNQEMSYGSTDPHSVGARLHGILRRDLDNHRLLDSSHPTIRPYNRTKRRY